MTDAAISRQRVEMLSGPTAALGAVTQYGRQFDLRDYLIEPRVFGRFAIVYIFAGSGWYEDEHHQCPVHAGDLILVWPDKAHRYGPRGGVWSEMYLVFDGPGFTPWDDPSLLDRSRPIVRLRPIELWRRRIGSVMSGEADVAPARLEDTVRLIQLLGQVVAARDAESTTPADEPVRQARLIIDEHAHQLLDLHTVAEEAGLAYPTFRRRFTEVFGKPPGRYRTDQVMQRARAMMLETGRTDARIASELGFSDPFHFSKRFKQVTGQTPSQYRRSLKRP